MCSVRGFREDRSESLRTLRRRRLVVRPPLKGYSASENQITPLPSSPALSLSPNVFSPPSQSSLSQRRTGRASWHSLVHGSSNRPKLLQRLVHRSIAAVPCPTVFLAFFLFALFLQECS